MKKYYTKPPIGLKPKSIHDRERIRSIIEAIERYQNASKEIPLEWIQEYNSLTRTLYKGVNE